MSFAVIRKMKMNNSILKKNLIKILAIKSLNELVAEGTTVLNFQSIHSNDEFSETINSCSD